MKILKYSLLTLSFVLHSLYAITQNTNNCNECKSYNTSILNGISNQTINLNLNENYKKLEKITIEFTNWQVIDECLAFCGTCTQKFYKAGGFWEGGSAEYREINKNTTKSSKLAKVYINKKLISSYSIIRIGDACGNLEYSLNINELNLDGYSITQFKNKSLFENELYGLIEIDAQSNYKMGILRDVNDVSLSRFAKQLNPLKPEILPINMIELEKLSNKTFNVIGDDIKINYNKEKNTLYQNINGVSKWVHNNNKYFAIVNDINSTFPFIKYYSVNEKNNIKYLNVYTKISGLKSYLIEEGENISEIDKNSFISCDYCLWNDKQFSIGDSLIISNIHAYDTLNQKWPLNKEIVFKCIKNKDFLFWKSELYNPSNINYTFCLGCYQYNGKNYSKYSLGAYLSSGYEEICTISANAKNKEPKFSNYILKNQNLVNEGKETAKRQDYERQNANFNFNEIIKNQEIQKCESFEGLCKANIYYKKIKEGAEGMAMDANNIKFSVKVFSNGNYLFDYSEEGNPFKSEIIKKLPGLHCSLTQMGQNSNQIFYFISDNSKPIKIGKYIINPFSFLIYNVEMQYFSGRSARYAPLPASFNYLLQDYSSIKKSKSQEIYNKNDYQERLNINKKLEAKFFDSLSMDNSLTKSWDSIFIQKLKPPFKKYPTYAEPSHWVYLTYTLKDLNGKIIKEGKEEKFKVAYLPFEGMKQIIQMTGKGSESIFYIPSRLCYGNLGDGDKIEPGMPLILHMSYVYLLDYYDRFLDER